MKIARYFQMCVKKMVVIRGTLFQHKPVYKSLEVNCFNTSQWIGRHGNP